MFYGVGNTGLPNPAAAFVEVLPDTSVNVTVGAADIGQGSSTMAATIAGGGLGAIAISWGYQRQKSDITWVCMILTVIIVQVIQVIGSYIARKTDHRIKQ